MNIIKGWGADVFKRHIPLTDEDMRIIHAVAAEIDSDTLEFNAEGLNAAIRALRKMEE